jgi:hypothetical protein
MRGGYLGKPSLPPVATFMGPPGGFPRAALEVSRQKLSGVAHNVEVRQSTRNHAGARRDISAGDRVVSG